ncbi:MAG: metallophosphoesterase family protein [Bacteroidetes Order II. Incertae sedis bacterium]|nr:metallophosphoesterase family protein [Bacteroidetes Order II. bacterium]
MTIGILSDTHHFFHPDLAGFLAETDLILHAGDIGNTNVLDQLASIGPEVRAVWGNIDGQELRKRLPQHQRFSIEGCTFWMTHIGGHPGRWDSSVRATLLEAPPHVFICGHSHILRIERVARLQNMLYINPGAAGMQGWHKEKTLVRLQVWGGKPTSAEVIHL